MFVRFLYAAVLMISIWLSGLYIAEHNYKDVSRDQSNVAEFSIASQYKDFIPQLAEKYPQSTESFIADISENKKNLESAREFFSRIQFIRPTPSLFSSPSSSPVFSKAIDSFIAPQRVIVKTLELTAKSAFAAYLDGQILYAKNANLKLPIGSITKLVSALISEEIFLPDNEIRVTESAISQEGDAGNLKTNETFLRDDILKIMLISSSNDAAYALAESAGIESFMERMNRKARELEMDKTQFIDPAGLNDAGYSTANDLFKLIKIIYNSDKEILNIISTDKAEIYSLQGSPHLVFSTDELIHYNEKGISVIGGKTGFTDAARGSLALISEVNKKVVITIVLGSEDRFVDTLKLLRWIRDNY